MIGLTAAVLIKKTENYNKKKKCKRILIFCKTTSIIESAESFGCPPEILGVEP